MKASRKGDDERESKAREATPAVSKRNPNESGIWVPTSGSRWLRVPPGGRSRRWGDDGDDRCPAIGDIPRWDSEEEKASQLKKASQAKRKRRDEHDERQRVGASTPVQDPDQRRSGTRSSGFPE
ncbi:unnamed protein product [Darwinula stevensoni]|uniref:Uncharacterized protein n=1 Tax=Darwinula stevensoni TaxID=69355 RepID=A0A7R8XLV1_9CRUS|nr:unnamed protein product [Darwinula stevensoni]CAG0894720.1 unnamed protein product [Darwinula stevensoni]